MRQSDLIQCPVFLMGKCLTLRMQVLGTWTTPKRCFDVSYAPKSCCRVAIPYIEAVMTMRVCSMSNVCSMLHTCPCCLLSMSGSATHFSSAKQCAESQTSKRYGLNCVIGVHHRRALAIDCFLHPQNKGRTRWYIQSFRYVSISIYQLHTYVILSLY